jgi:ABC-type ATPase involved in cell division
VAIARAVVTQPRLLIADEPTENLDHETAQEIVDRLEDVAEGGTAILLVTHSLDVMRRLRRRMLTLAEGRLVDDQPAVAASRDLFVLEPVH